MNTDPVCEICRIKITYDKAPFKLTCCNKNICWKCGEELTKKPRDPCPKCIKNLSLEKDIKLHQKIIQKEFDEIEPKINSHHLNNFKNHQKNLEKIHNYYTQQRDLQDFNTLNNTIRILRKDQDIKMTGYVNQVCTFQTKFRDFANKIKSPEFYHNNLDEAIDLINEYKIFFKFKIEIDALSSTKIDEFCQTSLTNALNEKSLESLKFLLDYKDLINEHFTRNYFLLNNYQEFFKLLKENFEPVFENKWPVTPDMLTKRLKSKIENDEKFIKILLEVKLMHIETERTKLFNVLKHIYELIDTFYEEIRDLKETNQVKYDEVVFKIEHFLKYEFIDVELNSEMLEDFFYFENLIQKCSFKNFKNLFSDKFKIADYAQEVINDYVSNKDKRKTLRTLKKTGELMDTFTIGFDIAKMFSYTILIGISFANLKACPYKGFLLPLTMILLGVIGLLFTSTRFTISILST
ncbi:unnamed protein product [Brachionus calyciflorus]|uniref:RING-type domain-containing protein n=1 Tax=Brachionus calyciflorus TaxID=104777 RepID=A0A814CQW6_9BILA|nr:unnamed protein product [Brachionus calyciflorus]